MAKKLLAVVLAVLIAVSAMAVTVFADYQIPLYKNADAWLNNQTKKTTQQMTFDIPVYGTFGWLTAGDFMTLNLPTEKAIGSKSAKWSLTVDGMSFKLGAAPEDKVVGVKPADNFMQARVTLGYLWHDYDGTDTTIPQTLVNNGIVNMRLACDVEYDNDWSSIDDKKFMVGSWWKTPDYATTMRAQWYHSVDGVSTPVAVESSVSYVTTWNYQKGNADKTYDGVKVNFVTTEWTDATKKDETVPFTWDHTLAARQKLIQAAANNSTIQLVVELDKEIVGQATYNLFANAGSGDGYFADNYQNLWWQHSNSRKWVAADTVDGARNKLVFDVPVSALYDNLYGTFNSQFVIFENINLLNNTIMKDYLNVDYDKVGYNPTNKTMGSFGRISWSGDSWNTRVRYDGKDVNYAKSGVAGKDGIGVNPQLVETSAATVELPADENQVEKKTGIKVKLGETYAFTANGTKFPVQYLAFAGTTPLIGDPVWAKDGSLYSAAFDKTIVITAEEIIKNGAKEGDEIVVKTNNWDGREFDAWTLKVATTNIVYTKLDSDVMATAVYLNIVEPEAAPDTTPDTPTEPGDNSEELEGGDSVNVEDNNNAPAKEDNPKTGVALAVVPMLVAAVAAVLAKKH